MPSWLWILTIGLVLIFIAAIVIIIRRHDKNIGTGSVWWNNLLLIFGVILVILGVLLALGPILLV
jgi:hypothetical protein